MTATQAPSALALPHFDKPVKLLVVVDRSMPDVAAALLAGAVATADLAGAETEIVDMPGARQLAPAVALAERMARFDGYVALGCVVQDEMAADNTTAADVSHALSLLGLQGAAVGIGLLAMPDRDRAAVLADPMGENKGGQAASAALHLIALSRKWASDTKGIGFRP